MSAQQLLLTEPGRAERAMWWAQSAANVFAIAVDEQMEHVAAGPAVRAGAFAVLRRKYEALRAEYFGRRNAWGQSESSDRLWNAYGPERAYREVYARFFPPVVTVAQ